MDINYYILQLLHIEEERTNKFIDLLGEEGQAFFLSNGRAGMSALLYDIIKERKGKPATTILKGSALASEDIIGAGFNIFDWADANKTRDVRKLEQFREAARKGISALGNNPLFLSLGAVRWQIVSGPKRELKEILSPLIIFPIELIRSGGPQQPVSVRFVDDTVFFNPGFYERLKKEHNEIFVKNFPVPMPSPEEIDTASFDLNAYFDEVEGYIERSVAGEGRGKISFERDTVCVSKYDNPDICMYHDIKRNYDKIAAHPLIKAVFSGESLGGGAGDAEGLEPPFILPYDSAQKEIIARVAAGESLVVKGPPGTGKTQTIANMIASLLRDGKKVLFVSKKISALGEVYNKMPADLRNFMLRMDYETERERIDVMKVHRELNDALGYKPAETGKRLLAQRSVAAGRKKDAENKLDKYKSFMFDLNCIAGGSYYDALNRLCKTKAEPVDFHHGTFFMGVTQQQYLDAYGRVKSAEENLKRITDNYSFDIALSPWLGVLPERSLEQPMLDRAKVLKEHAAKVSAYYEDRKPMFAGVAVDAFNLDTLSALAACDLSAEEANTILNLPDFEGFVAYTRQTAQTLLHHKHDIESLFKRAPKLVRDLPALPEGLEKAPQGLTLSAAEAIIKATHIYNETVLAELEPRTLYGLLKAYFEAAASAEKELTAAAVIYKESVIQGPKTNSVLIKSYNSLKPLMDSPDGGKKLEKKSGYKKALALTRISKYTDAAAVMKALSAVCAYNSATEAAAGFSDKINKIFHAEVSYQEAQGLFEALELCSAVSGGSAALVSFVQTVKEICPLLNHALESAALKAKSDITAGELVKMYKTAGLYAELVALAKENSGKYGFEFVEYGDGLPYLDAPSFLNLSRWACALLDLSGEIKRQNQYIKNPAEESNATAVRIIAEIKKWEAASGIAAFCSELTKFYGEYFSESVYADIAAVPFSALKALTHLGDRDYITASVGYVGLKSGDGIDLEAFFAPFERGERHDYKKQSLADIFEYSFFFFAAAGVDNALGTDLHICGRSSLERLISEYKAAESELFDINARTAAVLCASRFDSKNRRFDFLKSNPLPTTPCRVYFKQYAEQILSLKQCLIMSPSTISLLLRPEVFEKFDTVIIDEASQMPPEHSIPALYRSKQCVVVGDEWQMPPVKFFVKKSATDETDEGENVAAIDSALTLMLQNNAFEIKELISHYRSETETLIGYSQNEFYPKMITFPSVRPRNVYCKDTKGSYDLGLFDVFVKDAPSEKGENEAEARKVLEIIRGFFDRYYVKDRLTQSVGVVTFGLNQADLINRLIEKDTDLSKKILSAQSNAGGAPEKAFFVCTVLTVQGQETDHLILSATYSYNKAGTPAVNYGALTIDKLGKRVFNVAVTRARRSVTAVHSLPYNEVKPVHVKNYLRLVSEYDSDDSGKQFVSAQLKEGFFYKSVAACLEEAGVEKDRIVFNYGVTQNSVRIPVAVLNKDKESAALGIMCEARPAHGAEGHDKYIDRNVRYPDVLSARGWKTYPVFISDWLKNHDAEKDKLKKAIKNLV